MQEMMAMPEPEEKSETLTVAEFGFRLETKGETEHIQTDIDSIAETIIKPVFVIATTELRTEYDEEIAFKIDRVENGSIIVSGSLVAKILVSSGIAGVATGLLTNILTQNLYSINEKEQYEQLMEKLKFISKTYTMEATKKFNEKKRVRSFISLPKSTKTIVRDFYFDPMDFEEARDAIQNAVKAYHANIGRL